MDAQRITQEIVDLHVEFERFLGGESNSLDRVDAVLAVDFLFVGTDGSMASRSQVLDGLHSAAGRSALKIGIENVEVHWRRGDLACATYEEWQTVDDVVTSRRSTAVFEADAAAPRGLRWLSVHETWLQGPQLPA